MKTLDCVDCYPFGVCLKKKVRTDEMTMELFSKKLIAQNAGPHFFFF